MAFVCAFFFEHRVLPKDKRASHDNTAGNGKIARTHQSEHYKPNADTYPESCTESMVVSGPPFQGKIPPMQAGGGVTTHHRRTADMSGTIQ